MSAYERQEYNKKMHAIGEQIASKEWSLWLLTNLGVQKRQGDIISADLTPILQQLSEVDSCTYCENGWRLAKSSMHANRFAEHLEDLSAIGLEKARKMQSGYIKVCSFSSACWPLA